MTTDNDNATEVSLMIPATCPRGHVLEPRTVTLDVRVVQHTKTSRRLDATSWTCVCCLRADCYTAHTGEPAPEEILSPENFCRQHGWNSTSGWSKRVRFGSGRQFTDPDNTPDKTDKKRSKSMSHRDPTAVAALSATVGATQNRLQTSWRDHFLPDELPQESDREDVEQIGLDAWRESRAYARYRRHRHGNAA
ncbi:MAG: hypothetical protein ACJA07_004304 [Rhodococcus sp. (in: high G+C Gram-positive bacteria)]|jgi:hypothetical protein